MSYQVIAPILQFINPANGHPLGAGCVYFGRPDSDPKNQPSNRINVYAVQDNGSEVLLSQPVYFNAAGQPQYNGSAKQLKIELFGSDISYCVQAFDKHGSQKLYTARVSPFVSGQLATAVDSIKQLVVIPDAVFNVVGFYSGANVGGGVFTFDQSVNKSSHNGGTIIAPEAIAAWDGTVANVSALLNWSGSGSGCFIRQTNGQPINVDMFGANGGSADDTLSFQKSANFVGAGGGGIVRFERNHRILGALNVPAMVSLQGPIDMPGEILPGTSANYQDKAGVLRISAARTVTLLDSASISNAILIRDGLTLPFISAAQAASGLSAFSGTAVTAGGADVTLHNLLILGFNKAFYSSNFERSRLSYVSGDCTNGIDIRTAYDIPYLFQCHFWPFTTAHFSWSLDTVAPTYTKPGSLLTRSGFAYQFAAVGDWAKATNCFSYGYQNGFIIDSCDNLQLLNCGTDSYSALVGNTSVGYAVYGTSKDAALIGCQAASQGAAVDVFTSADAGGSVRISSCNFWKNDSSAVTVRSGRAVITGTMFRENAASIVADAGCRGLVILSNVFDNEVAVYTINSTALRSTSIGINEFYNCVDSLGTRTLVNNGVGNNLGLTASAASAGYSYIGAASRGSIAAPTISQSGDVSVTMRGQLYDGAAYRSIGTTRFQSQGAVAASDTAGMFVIATTPTGSVTPTDRIAVYRNGDISPLADNAQSCGITGLRWSSVWSANGTIQTSDERTKTDITNSALGLDFINSLRPVSYRFKIGGTEVIGQVYRDQDGNICDSDVEGAVPAELITEERAGTRTHWGLIAQEVRAAVDASGVDFAGWVLTDKENPDSPQALRYDQFIAPLIKAVQELSERVNRLEGK